MKKLIRFSSVVVTATLLSFTSAGAASKNAVRVLQYVPADTPYVIATTKPMPSKLTDKIEPVANEMLQAYQKVLRHIMAEQLVKMAQEGESPDDAAAMHGVMTELTNLMSIDGLADAGIDRDSAFVFYGHGILPVFRFELTEEGLFDAAVERMEEQSGDSMQLGEAGGESYKFVALDKVKLIVATLDEQAVLTVVPSAYDEAQIKSALGIDKPSNSLRKSKALRNLGKEYGFAETMIGFIDTQRIAKILTGQGSASDNDLFSLLGKDAPDLSPTCNAEIMEMASIAPRIVIGYTSLKKDLIESHAIIELRDDIAKGLSAVPAAVPGLGLDPGGFFSFGVGMNLLEMRNFYEARIEAMENDPYECEKFADIQASTVKGRELLAQPVPPVVYSFRGVVANIIDVVGLDMAASTPPESVDANVLLAMENAEALLAMAAMFDPQISALNLLPDGKPVRLDMPELAAVASDAFAALTSDAVSVAVGEGAESAAADALTADSMDPAPFMSMSIDAKRYYALIGDAIRNAPADPESGEEELPEAMQEAVSEIMTLSGKLYERISVDVHFTDKGVDIGSRLLLAD